MSIGWEEREKHQRHAWQGRQGKLHSIDNLSFECPQGIQRPDIHRRNLVRTHAEHFFNVLQVLISRCHSTLYPLTRTPAATGQLSCLQNNITTEEMILSSSNVLDVLLVVVVVLGRCVLYVFFRTSSEHHDMNLSPK